MRRELEAIFVGFFTLAVAIIACYFIPATILILILNFGELILPFLLPIFLILSGFTIAYIFYRGYRIREIRYFSITLALVGVTLIILGTLSPIIIRTTNTYNKDWSIDQTKYLSHYPINASYKPTDGNGSLRTITLSPQTTVYYFLSSFDFTINTSILQVDVYDATGTLNFTMGKPKFSYIGPEIDQSFFQTQIEPYYTSRGLKYTHSRYYWTPPCSNWGHDLALSFENKHDFNISFLFKTTVHYLRKEQRQTTDYNIDPRLAYGSIGTIGTAITIEIFTKIKKRTRTPL